MAMQAAVTQANNDLIVPNSPSDTVSAMLFSPTANFLATTSWNKEVREATQQRSTDNRSCSPSSGPDAVQWVGGGAIGRTASTLTSCSAEERRTEDACTALHYTALHCDRRRWPQIRSG